MTKGVGLMCAHYGVEVPKDKGGKEFKEWIGGYYENMLLLQPDVAAGVQGVPEAPDCHGVKPFAIRDEWYFNMRLPPTT